MATDYLVHIVACDENNAIGYKNKLLFKVSEDLKHFKRLTLGQKVICGRTTFESIPKLTGREMIVVSRSKRPDVDPLKPVDLSEPFWTTSLEDLLKEETTRPFTKIKPKFIIGGGEIYKQSLDKVSVIMMTRIHSKAKKADTFYPDILQERRPPYCTESSRHVDPVSGVEYSFVIYGYDREHLKHFLQYKAERERNEREKAKAALVRKSNP